MAPAPVAVNCAQYLLLESDVLKDDLQLSFVHQRLQRTCREQDVNASTKGPIGGHKISSY